jgi:uncharacterized SAM-binding protein YcdF (DUF218 family)
MFEHPQCQRPFVGVPLVLPAPLLWLMVLIMLGICLALGFWLRRNLRRKLWPLGIGTALLLLLLALAEPGVLLGVPKDPGTLADAIVILGRGDYIDGNRVEVAAQLWRKKRAPIIYSSGVYDGPRLQKLLLAAGVPATALDGDNCSLSTPENALFSAAILNARGGNRILLVTDAPHSWRARLEYEQLGFTVLSSPSQLPAKLAGLERGLLLFREYFFLTTTAIGHRGGKPAPDPAVMPLLDAAKAYGQQQPALRPRSE